MNVFEVPLQAYPQQFDIALGGINYQLLFQYRNTVNGGWTIDIADSSGNPILQGVPMVTGANLLEQYAYLDFPGALWVQGQADPDAVPTFTNLGTDGLLFFVTP